MTTWHWFSERAANEDDVFVDSEIDLVPHEYGEWCEKEFDRRCAEQDVPEWDVDARVPIDTLIKAIHGMIKDAA